MVYGVSEDSCMSVGFTRRYSDWVVHSVGSITPALWVVVSDLDSKKV